MFVDKATQDGFTQYFDARKEAQAQRRWANDLPGAEQAYSEHAMRMQEFEGQKQARREKREFAKATQNGFAQYFEARKLAQAQRRAFAQATRDGFTQYFDARKEAQAQRRWAKGLPGAEQAQAEHESRMLDVEARKQARRERREFERATQDGFLQYFKARKAAQVEKRTFAKATRDSFTEFFQARKQAQAQRRWAQGLPGAQQAQTEHETRMQAIEARRQERLDARREKQELAQATRDGFTQYFEARKAAQADRRWAQGLVGAEQAQATHELWMLEFEARKLARMQKREEQRQLESTDALREEVTTMLGDIISRLRRQLETPADVCSASEMLANSTVL
jgi:hypothetical protein